MSAQQLGVSQRGHAALCPPYALLRQEPPRPTKNRRDLRLAQAHRRMKKVKLRGTAKIHSLFIFALAAYNLVRLRTLLVPCRSQKPSEKRKYGCNRAFAGFQIDPATENPSPSMGSSKMIGLLSKLLGQCGPEPKSQQRGNVELKFLKPQVPIRALFRLGRCRFSLAKGTRNYSALPREVTTEPSGLCRPDAVRPFHASKLWDHFSNEALRKGYRSEKSQLAANDNRHDHWINS